MIDCAVMLYRGFSTQEEIDAEYNVEISVDLGPYVEFFVGESARARRELDVSLDERFGPTLDETVDVFPARAPGAPMIVFIHGGYWRRLSSKEFSLVALGLVERGFCVAVTNYSLCPKVTISEITRQSRAALVFLQREATRFGADPTRIYACGHSAGGHQVGMLLATDWSGEYGLAASPIRGGIPISGLFDLAPLRYSWLQPKILLDHETIRRESPLFHIPEQAPPILLSLGGDESAEFHRQTGTYLETWHRAGHEGTIFEQPGKNHFNAIEGFVHADSALCGAVADFVSRCEGGA